MPTIISAMSPSFTIATNKDNMKISNIPHVSMLIKKRKSGAIMSGSNRFNLRLSKMTNAKPKLSSGNMMVVMKTTVAKIG